MVINIIDLFKRKCFFLQSFVLTFVIHAPQKLLFSKKFDSLVFFVKKVLYFDWKKYV